MDQLPQLSGLASLLNLVKADKLLSKFNCSNGPELFLLNANSALWPVFNFGPKTQARILTIVAAFVIQFSRTGVMGASMDH